MAFFVVLFRYALFLRRAKEKAALAAQERKERHRILEPRKRWQEWIVGEAKPMIDYPLGKQSV